MKKNTALRSSSSPLPVGSGELLPLSAAGKVGVEPLVANGRVGDGRVEIVQIKTSTGDLYGCSDMPNALSPRNNY